MTDTSVETELSDDGMTQLLETAEPHRPLGEQVNDILAEAFGKPAEQPVETPDPPAEPPPTETWDIKTAAERLGVEPAELYDRLKVNLGDEELTIGQLKDRVKPQKDFEADRERLVKDRGELEADRIAARREIAAMQSGNREAYEAGRSEYLSREREALLRKVPEWADAGVVTADRAKIAELVKAFDFPPNTLDFVEDHRLFVLLRSYARDRAELAQLREAKAKAERPAPKVAAAPRSGQPQTAAQQFGRLKAAVTKGQVSRGAAIEAILRDAKVK